MTDPMFGGAGTLAQSSALVVDDDDFSRRTASRILRRLGMASVTEAAGGEEALRCVASLQAPLDLILCDLKMPGVDGVETLRSLAAAKVCSLIILVSGADGRVLRSARQMAASFGIGTLRSIEKPLTMQKLQDILAEARAERPCPADGRPHRPKPRSPSPTPISCTGWPGASSPPTSSPRWPWPAGMSWVPRRSSAGSVRATACSPPAPSSRPCNPPACSAR